MPQPSPVPNAPPNALDAEAPIAASLADLVNLDTLPHMLRRIVGLAISQRRRFAVALGGSVLANIATVLLPKLLGRAVDHAHSLLATKAGNAAAEHALLITAGLLILTSTLRGLLTMLSGYQFEYIGQKVAYNLRLALFEKLQRLDFSYHDRIHSGELITRGMLDLEGVRMFVENGLQRLISLTLLLGIGASAMYATDPLMATLALSFVPFVLWRAVRTGLVLRLTWTMLQQKMSVLTRVIEENLQGARVVRAFAAHLFEVARFDGAATGALRMTNRRIAIRSRSVASMTLSFHAAMALVLWVGGHRIARGEMTVGQLTTFLTFMLLLQAPVRQVMMVVNTFARAISSGSRLFEVLDREPRIAEPAEPLALPEDGTLAFEDVAFRYSGDGAEPWALLGISLTVRPGHTLGIIGAPGAGKSTLAHLIPRFYDVSSGRITLGGQDIRDLPLDDLRQAVAIVAQEVFRFDASLSENIAYSEPDAPQPAIERASQRAQLHEHVVSLPQAYDTHTGERGVALSGGQRQRLSIARGIIGDPRVLILDDSTSAVDTATEQRLRERLREFAARRVTLIISHRIASVRHADEIIVLDHGHIVERGTHSQLVAADGLYARLYAMQSQNAERRPAKIAALALESGR